MLHFIIYHPFFTTQQHIHTPLVSCYPAERLQFSLFLFKNNRFRTYFEEHAELHRITVKYCGIIQYTYPSIIYLPDCHLL